MTLECCQPRRAAEDLAGRKVTVIGLGRFGGGVGVTRWLCGQGALVTVSDQAPAEELADSVRALNGCAVELHLGGHLRRDFLEAQLLVVNPAVPREMPLLQEALAAGIGRTSEINLFLQRCPATMVGITGSVGKSTTTAMIGQILSRRYTTHVGGNIGRSLLENLPDIQPDHVVVLELSSFQLDDLPLVGISPHVAVVTNLQPNHLDRHGTMDAYAAAKRNLFAYQSSGDVLVLNARCPVSSLWASQARGKVAFFDPLSAEPLELAVPGEHNQANAQAAWTAAKELGIDRASAQAALREFAGLPHRLQFVCEQAGVRYFNDSKCTTPQGAIVALRSFPPRRAVIIVGGYDKHVDFSDLGAELAARAKAVVAIGKTQQQIIAAAEARRTGPQPPVLPAADLAEAVRTARGQAQPGDVVLLSPACASYDMFTNYEFRGQAFLNLVTNP